MRKGHNEDEMRPRRKKKSHKIYAAIVLTLGIIIICMSILILFYVQRIEIKGNQYCSDKIIAESIQNDKFSINTLYVMAKYAMGKGEIPAAVETMDVSLKNPWTLSVVVEEKEVVGYIEHEKERVYFDKDGLAIVQGLIIINDVPCVEGIDFKNVKLYNYLECDNPNVFDEIVTTIQGLKKDDLSTDRILYVDDRMYAYVGKICVSFGIEVTEDKVAQIAPIKKKLKKKKGTLHLENYSQGNETITFAIGEFPEEN